MTLVERKSRFFILKYVTLRTSGMVIQAIITSLKPLSDPTKIATYDNGKEFADHAVVYEAQVLTSYFADPFGSYQCGSNENFSSYCFSTYFKKVPNRP